MNLELALKHSAKPRVYVGRRYQVGDHEIQVLSRRQFDRIREGVLEEYSRGLFNIVVDGRAVLAGDQDGVWQKLATGKPVPDYKRKVDGKQVNLVFQGMDLIFSYARSMVAEWGQVIEFAVFQIVRDQDGNAQAIKRIKGEPCTK